MKRKYSTAPRLDPVTQEARSAERGKRLRSAVEGFAWALANCPSRLHVTDLEEIIYSAAVPRRIGPKSFATVTIRASPEMLAKIQRSDTEERFRFLLVAIPEEAIERIASPILLPGEVEAGG